MPTVYYQGSRKEARELIVSVVESLVGNSSEHAQAVQSVHTVVGLAALSDIQQDYIRKARGAIGEDGVKWAPLSPKTLAYSRRFGKGEQAQLKRDAGLGRGHRHGIGENTGLLSIGQKRQWQAIFASQLARFVKRGYSVAEAKVIAAKIAWSVLKRLGAKTKLEVYGHRDVEILRDTSVLLNSLSPGEYAGEGTYNAPADQIFRLTKSGVIVGTNVDHAAVHQNGSKKKGIPARPFLPKEVPVAWIERWIAAGTDALFNLLTKMFQRGANNA